jgi:ABC-type multidrug transport system ATPase subunit
MIKFRGVTKQFPGARVPALAEIDLTVRAGTVLGLVGRNGAGKSTLLRLAAGIARPTQGRISVAGHDLASEKEEASRVLGWVPESPKFEAEERPHAFLVHLARLDGRSGEEAERRARAALARVGLEDGGSRPIRVLSQGQLKRLAIAAAWLEEPTHLLYDEVTNGLDLPGRELLAASLPELRQRGGLAIFASHRIDEVEAWCDEIAVLEHGRLAALVPGRAAAGQASRRLRLVLDRPPDDRLERLRTLGPITLSEQTVTLELDVPAGRDLVGELAAEGFRLREVRSMRSDLAGLLGEGQA